ncbi:hypothetical protein QO004_000473 [Rhizobium mesoamericanum]|uniref:hypothetical protein n=1 Tax=Rhizobium mesoamericanum TaxID=1079800 RepID=UPI00278B6812|nr:hypothetical protein [Rhizobium mesoamericanum]MDQ0558698.1 hypothetical protein [Rhizobium mesoamericanum]
MTKTLVRLMLCATILSGCVSERSGGLVQSVQQDARSVQYNQIRAQLARSYDHPYDVPSLVLVSTANTNSSNSLKASFSHASAPAGITNATGFDFGAFTDNTQMFVAVTSGATAIQGMRDLYAYASKGDRSWEKSVGKVLINKPPTYPWLFRSTGNRPADCGPSCYEITKVGEYTYWARTEKDFSDFVLAILETSSFTRDTVVSAPGGGKKPAGAPSGIRRVEPTTNAPQILVVPSTQ